jgi:hypothetical protein
VPAEQYSVETDVTQAGQRGDEDELLVTELELLGLELELLCFELDEE